MSGHTFTPGPWQDVGPNKQSERCIFGADDSAVAVTIPTGIPETNAARSVANARLIAAAPDLLAALKDLDEAYCYTIPDRAMRKESREFGRKSLIAARAAIAKAVGP